LPAAGSVLVLLNPRADGGRAGRLADPLREWLGRHAAGAAFVVAETAEAARSAVSAQPEGVRVVVVGGDGTVHQVLPTLLARDATLALVPLGSGNDLSRALGLRRLPWQPALEHALRGHASPCDVGELVVGHAAVPFASSLAAGFDAAVSRRAVAGPEGLRGQSRYLWATLRELAALRTWRMKVIVDGVPWYDGPALFASCLNTPTYGAGMPAVPSARIDDGRLDLLIAGRFGRLGALWMLPRLLAGSHLRHRHVHTRPFLELRVESATPVPLAADGEVLPPERAFAVRVRRGALKVVKGTRGAIPPPPARRSR